MQLVSSMYHCLVLDFRNKIRLIFYKNTVKFITYLMKGVIYC